MPHYRLYHLDRHTGHIERAEEVFAADDVAAVHELQQRQSDHPLELWQQGRKVVRVDALPEVVSFAGLLTNGQDSKEAGRPQGAVVCHPGRSLEAGA